MKKILLTYVLQLVLNWAFTIVLLLAGVFFDNILNLGTELYKYVLVIIFFIVYRKVILHEIKYESKKTYVSVALLILIVNMVVSILAFYWSNDGILDTTYYSLALITGLASSNAVVSPIVLIAGVSVVHSNWVHTVLILLYFVVIYKSRHYVRVK